MKKKLALVMACVLAMMSLVACGGESSDVVKIGICQIAPHESLDEATQGFIDGLKEAGYVDGENVKIDFQNANGEPSTAQQICELFESNGYDLVLANATPAAQSAVNVFQDTDVPVLFTSVTDAVGAGLVLSNEAPGKNVTGTLDMPDISQQIQIIRDILPEAKTLAILYTSSEPNSKIQADEAKAAAEKIGFTVILQGASSSNDYQQVIESVADKADAAYIPSDNGFASAMATVNQTAVNHQLPVFCAVEAMVKEGGIATYAIDYYELGKQTAKQAVRILNGEKASEIPVEMQKEYALVVNEEFANSVGVEIPQEILDKAK